MSPPLPTCTCGACLSGDGLSSGVALFCFRLLKAAGIMCCIFDNYTDRLLSLLEHPASLTTTYRTSTVWVPNPCQCRLQRVLQAHDQVNIPAEWSTRVLHSSRNSSRDTASQDSPQECQEKWHGQRTLGHHHAALCRAMLGPSIWVTHKGTRAATPPVRRKDAIDNAYRNPPRLPITCRVAEIADSFISRAEAPAMPSRAKKKLVTCRERAGGKGDTDHFATGQWRRSKPPLAGMQGPSSPQRTDLHQPRKHVAHGRVQQRVLQAGRHDPRETPWTLERWTCQ